MKIAVYIALKIIAILLVVIGVMFFFGSCISYFRNSGLQGASIISFSISIISIIFGVKISKFAVSKKDETYSNYTGQENSNPIEFNLGSDNKNNGDAPPSSKTLKKSDILKKANEMLSSGKTKSEVFKSMSSGGKTDGYLANIIASHPDDFLCSYHSKKINIAINLMFLQAVIGSVSAFNIGVKFSFYGTLALASFCAAIPLLFAWGFYKNKAGFYNAYIMLTLMQLPRSLHGFQTEPLVLVGVVLNLLMLAYVWYLKSKLFPDFGFIMPKKIKGQYVFGN